ncbi:BolA family protein [Legionella micdadei]|uniref:Protein BolA n=1 Tax=Legionella micdadei TaxID=451 RepID=A0A098GCY7_LEGMI|nr:BolA family protein [Legionella micdadei]ARG98029.1 BolA family transcriptional regulator [Legionella micdadei]ARH00825.1 BolA family transcriptional regulator [Legionella micdadei]KTD30147.1 regulator of penicillin binding proteins and beta lactamase transcription (morphogene) [Legionella micdadei]NSL18478.1 BolA family transcriptional regulator [Legionella micdadei]CEG60343.1 Protein BolA [Legionella micdadei]
MTRKERISQLISEELKPIFLEVVDESKNHHVPEGAETHFKLSIVTEKFIGLTKIARHRLINNLLIEERNKGLHALSMHLYTPEEWDKSGSIPNSPACRDGYRHG